MGNKVVKLVSSAGTGYFYTVTVNERSQKKLLVRKYDPKVRKHVSFKQEKV